MNRRDAVVYRLTQEVVRMIGHNYAMSDETKFEHIRCALGQMVYSLEMEDDLEISGAMGQMMLYSPGRLL